MDFHAFSSSSSHDFFLIGSVFNLGGEVSCSLLEVCSGGFWWEYGSRFFLLGYRGGGRRWEGKLVFIFA